MGGDLADEETQWASWHDVGGLIGAALLVFALAACGGGDSGVWGCTGVPASGMCVGGNGSHTWMFGVDGNGDHFFQGWCGDAAGTPGVDYTWSPDTDVSFDPTTGRLTFSGGWIQLCSG